MRIPPELLSQLEPVSARRGPDKAFVHAKHVGQESALCGFKPPPKVSFYGAGGWGVRQSGMDINCWWCLKELGYKPAHPLTQGDAKVIFELASFVDDPGGLSSEERALLRKLRDAYPAVAGQYNIDLGEGA
jgi:hypothetical protein